MSHDGSLTPRGDCVLPVSGEKACLVISLQQLMLSYAGPLAGAHDVLVRMTRLQMHAACMCVHSMCWKPQRGQLGMLPSTKSATDTQSMLMLAARQAGPHRIVPLVADSLGLDLVRTSKLCVSTAAA